MYIEPNTSIYILQNVPIDNTYKHTLYFDNPTTQVNYFASLTKYKLDNYTYQRQDRYIRVAIKADALYNCNYLMYRNSAFGDKWFYAFITHVEYVNNECSNVSFEIDEMQTWLFNYTLAESYVIREHSDSDSIGDNIVDEGLAVGEYVFNDYEPTEKSKLGLANYCVILGIADFELSETGGAYGNVFSGITLYAYPLTVDNSKLMDKINEYAEKPDSIVMMYMCPQSFIPRIEADNRIPNNNLKGVEYTLTFNSVYSYTDFNGYVPKNNKLYTYPYNFFHVDNNSASGIDLRYEFFANCIPTLNIKGSFISPIQIVARPTNYKGATNLATENCTIEGFPQCMWVSDFFKMWLANNAVPSAIGAVASIGANLVSGNAVGAITSGVSSLASFGSGAYKASISSDVVKGNFVNGGVNVAYNQMCFNTSRCHITADYAKMIDDYFTMYGYATQKVKVPNRNARPHWTYCKTLDAVLIGNRNGGCPSDSLAVIKRCYDNGITWWNNGSEVGNYSLDNKV